METNGLINEKSPYLRQHARNPVNWQPWREAVFDRARAENKPIFLSIGYATCHWCHVMARESFEDAETAGYLNDTFVCIKVDREERPDIDAVYMAACQMLTGGGGWPLSIVMTPGKEPFYAATYLPRRSRFGRPGLIDLCLQVKREWEARKESLTDAAAKITVHIGRAFEYQGADTPGVGLLDQAYGQIHARYDPDNGGFESAPKFPSPHRLRFLLRMYHRTGDLDALAMTVKTLTAMRLGGIWDHVGLGFHRYATDARWRVPHFEKMLYDQAQIATAYVEAFQVTSDPLLGRAAREIFDYVLRDMTAPEGGFYSAEDADSEGEEGRFYVWRSGDFRAALPGLDAVRWAEILNLRPEGNYLDEATKQRTGANILHLSRSLSRWSESLGISREALEDEWRIVRQRLFHARDKRARPFRDDKILTDWNGLMICALAMGAGVFGEEAYNIAARKAADFILSTMRDEKGRLYHRFRDGERAIAATADDYAFFIHGLLGLYRSTFDLRFAETARDLQSEMISAFWDDENGGFYTTAGTDADLPLRPKGLYDGAIPSANSISLENLLLLHRLTGEAAWEERAQKLVRAFAGTLSAQSGAYTGFLCGLDMALQGGRDIIVSGAPESAQTRTFLAELGRRYDPNRVTLVKSDENADRLSRFAAYTDRLPVIPGRTTAHLCKGGACTGATADLAQILETSKS